MSGNRQTYAVRSDVLWFRAIGRTSSDALLGFPERSYTVFSSEIAKRGDIFAFVDGHLIHMDRTGALSRGAFRLHGTDNSPADLLEATKLLAVGALDIEPAVTSLHLPPLPDHVFTSSHCGIERNAVSPAFAEMMDATEDFRHACDDEGGWAIICSDFGASRTVTMSIVDPETGHPAIYVEHDPLSDVASLTVHDEAMRESILETLSTEGIRIGGAGVFTLSDWHEQGWQALSDGLASTLLASRRADRYMSMAMSA